MKDYINNDLEKYFTPNEIGTIKKFMAFVADSNNQAKESNFSIAETDDEIKTEVQEWLENRYKKGHYKRKNN